MRPFTLIPMFLALLAVVGASAGHVPKVSVMRRISGKPTPSTVQNLTEAQVYARSLTHRPPTRRFTAQRRVISALSLSETSITVGATNSNTGSPLGALSITGAGLSLGPTENQLVLTTDASPSWASRTERRITIPGLTGFNYLGAVQFSSTSGLTLGAGLSNGLAITGLSSPTTAGAVPTYGSSYGNTGPQLAGETDIWSIDYTTGRITLQWVNPDGSTPNTVLISNGVNLAATGDLEDFNTAFGPGWFAVSLAYSNFIA